MPASILTNTSAMVALQTLRTTNKDLAQVNSQISTGKKIATAKDSAAVFAISKVMESDVAGFKAISDSLNLGSSTVAVASNASSQIGSLLEEIKTKIVSASEENVDRQKIQDEIVSLRSQVSGIVSAAQFNGLNLVDGSVTAGSISILSSLDRDSSGAVTTNNITVSTQNLSISAGTDVSASASTSLAASLAASDGTGGSGPDFSSFGSFSFLDNSGGATGGTALARDAAGVDLTATGGLVEGDVVELTIGSVSASYVIQVGDAEADVAAGVRTALISAGLDQNEVSIALDAANGELDFENQTNAAIATATSVTRGSGSLAFLATVDVTSAAAAATALTNVETAIQSTINAQAAFGTSEKRIELQSEFMSSLIDSFKSGIGALVDADLEEASARLQALQVQQQLGIQALSIANQAPQNILALFR